MASLAGLPEICRIEIEYTYIQSAFRDMPIRNQ
jgi:hypothetical protein